MMKIGTKFKRMFWFSKLFLIVFFFSLSGGPALATPVTISYSPTPVERNIGQQWAVSIFFDGSVDTAGVLSLYHVDFRFDPDVIAFHSLSFGENALDGSTSGVTSYILRPYPELGFTDIDLKIEGSLSPFKMTFSNTLFATVVFDAVGVGESDFQKSGWGMSGCGWNWDDGTLLDFAYSDPAKIEVTGSSPVPEPSTMLLFGAGLAGLAAIRRRREAS